MMLHFPEGIESGYENGSALKLPTEMCVRGLGGWEPVQRPGSSLAEVSKCFGPR